MLYVVIGLTVVCGAILLALYDAERELNSDVQMQWIASGVFTCFVFGFVVGIDWKVWRSRRGVALFLGLLALHSLLMVWVVQHIAMRNPEVIPLPLYTLLSLGEIAAFSYISTMLLKPKARRAKGSGAA